MKKTLFLFLSMLGASGLFAQPVSSISDFKTFNAGRRFTCITVDANNNVWAGTTRQGLFKLNQQANPQATEFSSVGFATLGIQALAADTLNTLWIGHAGTNTSAAGGGIDHVDINTSATRHYVPDRNAKCFVFLARDGIATQNVKSLTVDGNNTVWSAHRYHDLTSGSTYILTPGAMSYKRTDANVFTTIGGYDTQGQYPEWPYPAYTCNPTPTQTPQTRICNAIASNGSEVWISVAGYTYETSPGVTASLPPRILQYDLDGNLTGTLTFASLGIPAGGIFNAIYLSPDGDAWVSISAGKGLAVRKNGVWKRLTSAELPCILPAGAAMNENAIWGNGHGNVFIGTNRGLIAYNGRGAVDSVSSYTLYSTATNSMTSNNILGGYSERDSIQWVATDNGIMKAIIGRYDAEDQADHVGEEDLGYMTCNNPHMDSIEQVLGSPDKVLNESYHIYKVETEICSQNGPNGGKCSAENIYKMIMDDIGFTSPTPLDFPYDNLSPLYLVYMDDADLKQLNDNVHAWPAIRTPENKTGAIETLRSVTSDPDAREELSEPGRIRRFLENYSRPMLTNYQLTKNGGAKTENCKQYRLYNNAGFIATRLAFDITLDLVCTAADLESESYDPIFPYASAKSYTITNYTKKGHFLWPGKVTRKVVEECGTVKVVTIGEGLQYCGDNPLGKLNARGNFIAGSILFKNIDLRLKLAFEQLP